MSNFRFHRRVKIFPGLAVNLSKSGPSFTVDVRGAHVTVGRGRLTRIAGRRAESLSAFPLVALAHMWRPAIAASDGRPRNAT